MITISKKLLFALVAFTILPGCAPVPSGSSSGNTKDIELSLNSYYNLDTAIGKYSDTMVEFDGVALATSVQSDGKTHVTIKLLPAIEDDYRRPGDTSKLLRIVPNPQTITLGSSKLKDVPLKDLRFKVCFHAGGTGPAKINWLFVKATQEQNQQHITDIRRANGVDTASFLIPSNGTRFDLRLDENEQGFGYKRTLRMSEVPGREGLLYLGEDGGYLYLDKNGWQLIQPAAGPGGSDYSFLENASTRGEFD